MFDAHTAVDKSRGGAAIGDRRRRASARGLPIAWAHLAVLWTFAVVQPLFDLVGRNATFFVARDSATEDIVVFALAFAFIPPTVLVAIEAGASLVEARLARWLHLVFIAGLVGLFFLRLLKTAADLDGAFLLPAAGLLGVAGGMLYARWEAARSTLTVLSPAPLLFIAVFLLFSPVHKLVLGTSDEASASGAEGGAPVVMILLDELPLTSLLDGPNRIDSARYPNFARLARTFDWYPNTSATAENTEAAVPAIMTGDWPRRDALPTASDHPQSIFTIFGGARGMNVWESVTRLCPSDVCDRERPPFWRRLRSLASDLGVVSLHQLLPRDLEDRLPSVDSSWGDFGGDGEPGAAGGSAAVAAASRQQDRLYGIKKVIGATRVGRRPSLNLAHSLLPHIPWQYLPSGNQYGEPEPVLGLNDETWTTDEWAVVQGYQRHLLQLGFVDRLLGQALESLRDKDMYDRSLIVVAADHGVSFRPGGNRRIVSDSNVVDIAPVPLFIKAPHQRRGRVIATHLQTIDILPTVLDMLNLKAPWKMDGRSALEPGADRGKIIVRKNPSGEVVVSARRLDRLRAAALARQLSLFPPTESDPWLLGAGPRRDLHGDLVPRSSVDASQLSATLDQASLLDNVDLRSGFVPSHLTGEIRGDHARALNIAIAVNGRIVATTGTLTFLGQRRFSAIVPESSLRPGRNRVELFALGTGGDRSSLERIPIAGRVGGRFTLHDDEVRGPGGRRYAIEADRVKGWVDTSEEVGNTARFRGWAGSPEDRRPASWVIVFVDGQYAGAVRPNISRPDVAEAWNAPIERSGYSLEVATSAFPEATESDVKVYAVEGTVASELSFDCDREPQDFECG